jgi:hypothetical protein
MICKIHGEYFREDQEDVGIEFGCPYCFGEEEWSVRQELKRKGT